MTGWRKRQVVDMAREAGFVEYELEDYTQSGYDIRYERFAELVRADERDKFLAALRQLHDSYSLASDPNGLKERGQA